MSIFYMSIDAVKSISHLHYMLLYALIWHILTLRHQQIRMCTLYCVCTYHMNSYDIIQICSDVHTYAHICTKQILVAFWSEHVEVRPYTSNTGVLEPRGSARVVRSAGTCSSKRMSCKGKGSTPNPAGCSTCVFHWACCKEGRDPCTDRCFPFEALRLSNHVPTVASPNLDPN